jgi:uncharacterized protein
MSESRRPFHYSFHVGNLDQARAFYGGLLGCREGRSTATWVDFDFFGNQISLHLGSPAATTDTGSVDGIAVPMPHFGALLSWDELQQLVERFRRAAAPILLGPLIRYPGQPAEQEVLFVRDPFGNALELKAFKDTQQIYAR